MRQFNYFYSSFIENKHGFFSFIPHAKLFHPYFGLAEIGNVGEKKSPYKSVLRFFHSTPLKFSHKIKIFFPEIREGMFYIDKVKYSVHADPLDDVKIKYQVKKDSLYYDYVQIKNHLAEFEIEVIVDTKYSGVFFPIEVNCDYIDILIYKQRISLTETVQSIKILPYLAAHRTNEPLYYLNFDSNAIIHMRNTTLTYSFILPIETIDFLKRFKVNYTEVKPRMGLYSNEGTKLLHITVDAFSCKYMAEYENYEKASNDLWPIINDAYFSGSLDICKKKVQSWWYTTIYEQNFTINDYPVTQACIPLERCFSSDETRGYVWNKVFRDFRLTETSLEPLAKEKLGDLIYMTLYQEYKTLYLKEKKQ